jgi:hypothetical protein
MATAISPPMRKASGGQRLFIANGEMAGHEIVEISPQVEPPTCR